MATSTAAFISVEEYLDAGDYQPDVNYVDGEIEERHMGEYDHSAWQEAVLAWFGRHTKEWGIRNRPAYRVQVKPSRLLVPDFMIVDAAIPAERIAVTAPIAVFEIWSAKSSVRRLMRNLTDYKAMGIPQIWFIDPADPVWQRFESGHLRTASRFVLPDRAIDFDMQQNSDLVE
jgi:Uma2 family endonuclease